MIFEVPAVVTMVAKLDLTTTPEGATAKARAKAAEAKKLRARKAELAVEVKAGVSDERLVDLFDQLDRINARLATLAV
jgi:hypothetical protein